MLAFAPRFGAVLLLLVGSAAVSAQNPDELRKPSAFSGILDTQARSRALFTEAAKVIMHPRCVNCHPASDRPTQGDDMHPHSPSTARGIDGGGVPGNTCGACHSDRNLDIFPGQQTSFRSIPGHSRWHLAPEEMAWEGKSIGDICRQIKDPQRNGGAISNCCTSIWRMTIWSRGAGIRDQGAIRFPAHRSCWASSFAPGSIAGPRAHEPFDLIPLPRVASFLARPAAPPAGRGHVQTCAPRAARLGRGFRSRGWEHRRDRCRRVAPPPRR